MKGSYAGLMGLVIPVILIVVVCYGAVRVLVGADKNRMEVSEKATQERIEDIKGYEEKLYRRSIEVVKKERTKWYVIMFGLVAIVLLVGLKAVNLIIRLPKAYMANPTDFEFVHTTEAEALRYLKDKLAERRMLEDGALLAKKDVMRLLTYRPDE